MVYKKLLIQIFFSGVPKVFDIKPEEIPEVPKNNFLLRVELKENGNNRSASRNGRVIYSRSGRKIIGRGAVVS